MTDSDIDTYTGACLTDNIKAHIKKSIIALENTEQDLSKLVKSTGVREIPIIDSEGRLVDIYIFGLRDKKRNFVAQTQLEDIKPISKSYANLSRRIRL